MADKPMDVYLNDHLAGAKFGSDLAERLRAEHEGTPLGELMRSLAPLIEQDRQTLVGVIEAVGAAGNPVKQATTWAMEKVSWLKFSGVSSGEADLGTFLALETLMLGVTGKRSLWIAIQQVSDQYPQLVAVDFDELITRAESQHDLLERERVAAGRQALRHDAAT